ncbi:Rid family hydrolase [Rhizorhabdus sp. FW153]|uniref:Rid family hydrolase n=1 Tax=Rhizorhabdus sp. FW153 TaxID=3400216 RepID=UPI003CF061B4
MTTKTIFALLLAATAASAGHAAGVERKQPPNAMIAASAKVPPGTTLIWLSGSTASPTDPNDPKSVGNTEAQTLSVLTKMKAQLAEYGLTMGDIVKLNVYLVGDPALGGKADRPGMTASYQKFFGTAEQPNRPTRTTVQVAALGRPETLVEIEAVVAQVQ